MLSNKWVAIYCGYVIVVLFIFYLTAKHRKSRQHYLRSMLPTIICLPVKKGLGENF